VCRELSNHANELFALRALDGEVLLDQDPWTVVQPGYGHDWNQHGGSAYLHQHLVTDYAACWQQTLANGEWDAAVCDKGTSRQFNYYVEGLAWSIQHAPFINGIYYDGINFDRTSMIRVRRAADAAAAAIGSAFPPLLDLHTGEEAGPPACTYAGHYPFMDFVWNGEGFDFSGGDPAYWLVEVSSQQHGLAGDLLGGGGGGNAAKGMLFGMTERNSDTATALWAFWDAAGISATAAVGWWEDDAPVAVAAACPGHDNATTAAVLASTYTAYRSHAIIAVASWCPQATAATLALDWAALGLDPATAAVTAPAIADVQAAGGPFDAHNLTFALPPSGQQGLILLVTH